MIRASDIYDKRKDELHELAVRQRRELARLTAAQGIKNKKIAQLKRKLKKARDHNTAIAEQIEDAFYEGWYANQNGCITSESAWEDSTAHAFLKNKDMV